MVKNEWASLLDTLIEAWNKVAVQIDEFAKTLSNMFAATNNVESRTYMAPRKRQRPPKKINCYYSVERRIQQNLPYQRRIF